MRPFRFGVVAAPQGAERWVADVKRIADLGYSTVLMPDRGRTRTVTLATGVACPPEATPGTRSLERGAGASRRWSPAACSHRHPSPRRRHRRTVRGPRLVTAR